MSEMSKWHWMLWPPLPQVCCTYPLRWTHKPGRVQHSKGWFLKLKYQIEGIIIALAWHHSRFLRSTSLPRLRTSCVPSVRTHTLTSSIWSWHQQITKLLTVFSFYSQDRFSLPRNVLTSKISIWQTNGCFNHYGHCHTPSLLLISDGWKEC